MQVSSGGASKDIERCVLDLVRYRMCPLMEAYHTCNDDTRPLKIVDSTLDPNQAYTYGLEFYGQPFCITISEKYVYRKMFEDEIQARATAIKLSSIRTTWNLRPYPELMSSCFLTQLVNLIFVGIQFQEGVINAIGKVRRA